MTQSVSSSTELTAHPGKGMNAGSALWLVASLMLTYLAASTAPTPLYALYRDAWGFSALTLTLIFASYVFALLASLLIFGALSDYLGRRPVILVTLALEMASLVLFRNAQSVSWLFAGRILQGAATGIAMSALSAWLLDLNKDRGALLNSLAPLLGMGLGALGTGIMAEFAPAPTRLVYDVLLAIFAVQALATLYLPETVSRKSGALRSLKPRVAVPARARGAFLRMLPINTANWALGGFYTSLGPTLGRLIAGTHSPTLGGAVVAALVLSGAFSILFVRQRSPRFALSAGAATLAAGICITLVAVQMNSTATFFTGSVIAGLGFGAAFNGSLRSVVPLAQAHERAGLMSMFYIAAYLAFSVPALIAGVSAGQFGLHATVLYYGAVLIAMSLLALGATLKGGKSTA